MKYDLIVAGTGFASSFFLKKYLEKAGINKKVLVLERGVYFPHSERIKMMKDRTYKSNLKPVAFSNTYENVNPVKRWTFDPNFGGSSNCWTACTPRFMPNDFKLKSKYGVGTDWPIDYDDLEAYYTEAEDILVISGPEETPWRKTKNYPLPPHLLSNVDQILQKQYGNMYISQPTARASRSVGKRGTCCTSSVCNLCPVDSKFTVENTLMNLYEDPRVEVLYNAQVLSLDLANDNVSAVHYNLHGETKKSEGDIFVLGTNAIFNAHILLNSGDSNKMVGKGLTEQFGIFADLYLDGLDNYGGSSIITCNGFMMYDGEHRKNEAGCLIEHLNYPYLRNEYGKWRKIAKFKFIFEELPNNDNKVELTDDRSKPRVNFNGPSEYVKNARKNLERNISKYFSVLPVEKVLINDNFEESEYHICSTTRMSNDASNGVVDKNMLHHQYRNLFVLGSSVFPTVTPANPTLTLSALSLMAADNVFNKVTEV